MCVSYFLIRFSVCLSVCRGTFDREELTLKSLNCAKPYHWYVSSTHGWYTTQQLGLTVSVLQVAVWQKIRNGEKLI